MSAIALPDITRLLRKDIREAAQLLTVDQARWFVDYYYAIQDFRIQSGGQVRSANQAADGYHDDGNPLASVIEPHSILAYTFDTMTVLETTIKNALDDYSNTQEVGRWARSITGVGPVIAAGLLAHIDIRKAPTAGHIWRYAGLDPSTVWTGAAASREMIASAFSVEESPEAALVWISKALNRYALSLYDAVNVPLPSRDEAIAKLAAASGDRGLVELSFGERPWELGAAIRNTADRLGQSEAEMYRVLFNGVKIDKAALGKSLARRPWNTKLKTLCAYKLGESFVKVQGNENDVYGKVYVARKEQEWEKNLAGDFAEQARGSLAARNFGADTDARAWYSGTLTADAARTVLALPAASRQGALKRLAGEPGSGVAMLPPARIHRRSVRYAVKLFLAHYQAVAYEVQFGTPPPKPYAVEHLGHAHFTGPPNWPMK